MAARLRRARPDRHPHRGHVRHDQRRRRGSTSASRSSSSSLGLAMFDVLADRFLAFSARHRHGAASRGSVRRSRSRWARSRRCSPARACAPVVDPGRAVLEQSLRDRHDDRARAAVRASASAWRFPGRSPAPGSPRCRSRACGWCASSRCSASSSSRPPRTTATRRYRLFANRWVDPDGGGVERRGAVEGGLALVARRRARRRRARTEAGADRHVGDVVQELPDDGQDDAGEQRRCRRRWPAT